MRAAALAACALALGLAGPALGKVGPVPVAATSDGVWVGTPQAGLVRIDPDAERPRATAPSVAAPVGLAAGGGRLWALDARGERIVRLTRPGGLAAARALGGLPGEVALGHRSIWAVVHRGARAGRTVLLRIDPLSLRVRGTFHLGRRAVRLGTGHGAAWLAFDPVSRRAGAGLVAIDEGSGRLLFRRRLRGNPWALAAGATGMWVVMARGRMSRLLLIDPRAGTVARAVPGPTAPGGADARSGLLWVTSLCEGAHCDISLASARAYDDRDGRLLAGPFRPWSACRNRAQQVFMAGVAALPGGAAVTMGDGRGGLRLAVVSARRGVVRCLPA